MTGILIVDDEINIREGIRNAIPWGENGIQVLGEASDGKEGLQKVRDLKPDIVITDIHMDEMSGLEFSALIIEEFPETRIIIVTGYDYFDYAQKAVELGVFSYLMKPILPEELLSTVIKIVDQIDHERAIKQKVNNFDAVVEESVEILKDQFLWDLFESRIDSSFEFNERAKYLGVSFPSVFHVAVVAQLDGYKDLILGSSQKKVQSLILGTRQLLLEYIGKSSFSGYPRGALMPFCISIPAENEKKAYQEVIDGANRALEGVKKHLSVTVTIGIGSFCRDPYDLDDSYSDALKALGQKLLAGSNSVISIRDVHSLSAIRHSYPLKQEAMILSYIQREDSNETEKAIRIFFHDLQEKNISHEQARIYISQLVFSVAKLFIDAGLDIYEVFPDKFRSLTIYTSVSETINKVEEETVSYILSAMDSLKTERNGKVKSAIQMALDYIHNNITDYNLSLMSVADYLTLSSSYFSKLFKREIGKSYLDYITQLRIDEAKRLLAVTNKRIADIGGDVGYPNPQYFCTLFKKVEGEAPAEYREKHFSPNLGR